MRVNMEKELQSVVATALADCERRNAVQLRTLVTEIDKVHENFDRRLSKIESSMARDKTERMLEEQEMGKLIANSNHSPASTISRFRMTQTLSNR